MCFEPALCTGSELRLSYYYTLIPQYPLPYTAILTPARPSPAVRPQVPVPAAPLQARQSTSVTPDELPVMAVPHQHATSPLARLTTPKKFCPPRARQRLAHCAGAGSRAVPMTVGAEYPAAAVSKAYEPVGIVSTEDCAKQPV